MTGTIGEPHVDANDLAAYVNRQLDAAARTRVEAHLADCAACRADALAALRARPKARMSWRVAAPALAAAAVAILVLPRLRQEPAPVDLERGGSAPIAVTLAAPDTGATLAFADVALAWRPAALDADYRVTVTVEDGSVAFTGSTRDTVATVPAASLRPATRYLWVVDAILPDGAVRSSTSGSFAIRP